MSESEIVDERLTDEERARLAAGLIQHVLITEPEIADVAKLLRIHDRLQQRVEDEREQTRAHVQAQMLAEAKVRELERATDEDEQ